MTRNRAQHASLVEEPVPCHLRSPEPSAKGSGTARSSVNSATGWIIKAAKLFF